MGPSLRQSLHQSHPPAMNLDWNGHQPADPSIHLCLCRHETMVLPPSVLTAFHGSKWRPLSYREFMVSDRLHPLLLRRTPHRQRTTQLAKLPESLTGETCAVKRHRQLPCICGLTAPRYRALCFRSLCKPGSDYRNNGFRRVNLAFSLTRKQQFHSMVDIQSMILLSVLNP